MKHDFEFAIKQTIPVMMGYIFMGIAYGLMLDQAGYGILWAFMTSLCIYAGSIQFILVSMLTGGMGLVSVIVMTFSVNSRHIFYGLSFIEKFRTMGRAFPYMIFSLTDETYALLCGTKIPDGTDKERAWFMIAALDQCWWVTGSVLGAVFGTLITFDITGIDFAMTALFAVIALEQWLDAKTHIPALTGLVCGTAALLIFGPDRFILPALAAAVGILVAFRKKLEKKTEGEEGEK